MDQSLPLTQPVQPKARLLRQPAFWLALLALLLLGILESRFIAWCWPTYGEATCSRYSLPLNFLIDLAFLLLVVLIYDRRWWVVLLAGLLAVAVYHAGSLPRLAQNIFGGASLFQAISPLAGWVFMALYLALLRFYLPTILLRWLVLVGQGSARRLAWLFGLLIAAYAAAYHIILFGGAGLLSPGSVAPGYVFTPLDLLGALLSGLAGWLALRTGSALRTRRV